MPGWVGLVSGGNRGIGLEVVRALLQHAPGSPPATIFVGCRDLEKGQELVKLLTAQAAGNKAEAVQLDVTSALSIAKAVATVESSTGHLDCLVNNAGVMLDSDGQFDLHAARAMMQTNFEGVVSVTTAFLPLLLRGAAGASVLTTSSGVGARTMGLLSDEHRSAFSAPMLDDISLAKLFNRLVDELGDLAHPYHTCIPTIGYGVSKAAVNCYTQALAQRYPTLRVNACSPGFTNTDMCLNYSGSRIPKVPMRTNLHTFDRHTHPLPPPSTHILI